MKKIIYGISIFLLLTVVSCVVTYDTFSLEDIKKYAEEEYDIKEWYTSEYNVRDEAFMNQHKDQIASVINCFEEPSSAAFAPDYRGGHYFFMLIGKNSQDEFKFIVYNVHVKKGTELKDAVNIIDYHLPYTFDDLFNIIDELDHEYYKDVILDFVDRESIKLDLNAMLEGRFEISRYFAYMPSSLHQYKYLKLYFDEAEGQTELILDAKKQDETHYKTIYTSSDQRKVEKIDLSFDDFETYFSYETSYQIETKQAMNDHFFQVVHYYLDIIPSNQVVYHNLNVDVILRFTYSENGVDQDAFAYLIKNLNNTRRIYQEFSDYDNIEDINQTVEFRDVSGTLYIIAE